MCKVKRENVSTKRFIDISRMLVFGCLLMLTSCSDEDWITQNYVDGQQNEYIIKTVREKNGSASQGLAIYNDLYFDLNNGGMCNVYRMDEKHSKPLCKINLAGLDKNVHCNCGNFSNYKKDGASFPLLYVSNGTSNVPSEYYCFVESITQTSDSVFTSELAQVIALDKTRFKDAGLIEPIACPQWLVDNERNKLWAFSLTTRSTIGAMGDFSKSKVVATCFRIPDLAEGDTVVIDETDVLKQSVYPTDAYIVQGGTIKDGIIYVAWGYGGTGGKAPTKIRAYSTDTGEIDLRLDLDGIMTHEPEDLYFYDNKLYLNTPRYIFSIEQKDVERMIMKSRLQTRSSQTYSPIKDNSFDFKVVPIE